MAIGVTATIVEFSFYPTPEEATWGCLHVETDGFEANPWGRRGTMRGDADFVRALKEAYHDRGPMAAAEVPEPTIAGGTWQITPGWPDDWEHNHFDVASAWSEPFTIGDDGRPVPV